MLKISELIDKLSAEHSLSIDEYAYLIGNFTASDAAYAAQKAVELRRRYYADSVFIRGLIEISNYCKNNCYYCGIRRDNRQCDRYRLTKEQIMSCCDEGYCLGFRTFVMQGGEDLHFTDEVLCDIISEIKSRYPDCAVTLSLGERSRESYTRLFDAGADRYLLRHETANEAHYRKLHPSDMSWENRIRCLETLREIGFQVGCGFMVGSPFQTTYNIAEDLKFIEKFKPHMCGIGPFIPHHATPFSTFDAGSPDITVFILSLVRIMHPAILLPATTALGSVAEGGRERGILAGANVIMPNLSPMDQRRKYQLYDNKLFSGSESAQALSTLREKMRSIGYQIVTDRGDSKIK